MIDRPAPLLVPIIAALGCGSTAPVRTTAVAGPPAGAVEVRARVTARVTLDHDDALGISGSCRNAAGDWFVAERNGKLFHIDKNRALKTYSIEGLPTNVDLEGLACTDTELYVSTETETPDRSEDLVLVVAVAGDRAAVQRLMHLQYPDPLRAGVNQGLEGLCIAGDWLIAAGEILRAEAGMRQAPILRQRIGEEDTFLHWVNLTSTTGKISGLDCRMDGETIEIFGIERHYEISRVVHYRLGDAPSNSLTTVEMAGIIRDTENFESILVSDDGEIRLVNDNQYKTITGPTEQVVLEPVPALAR